MNAIAQSYKKAYSARMGQASKKMSTYQDVCEAPAHLVAEVIDGQLETHPRPAAPHACAASVLGIGIGGPFYQGSGGGPGGWVILDEPELHLGDHILVPDLAGWRRERMPVIPDDKYFTLVPDWVAEILSPSTGALDRTSKMRIYGEQRVEYMWLIDPVLQTLEVYHLERGKWMQVNSWAGEVQVRAEPFDAIALDLGALWAR